MDRSELSDGEDSWVDERCASLTEVCSVVVFLFRFAIRAVKLELVVIIFSVLFVLGVLFDSTFIARLLISFTRFRILFVLSYSFGVWSFNVELAVVSKDRCAGLPMDSLFVFWVLLKLLRAVRLLSIEIRWLIWLV